MILDRNVARLVSRARVDLSHVFREIRSYRSPSRLRDYENKIR